MTKRNVFISYHHRNDQEYKNYLLWMNNTYDIFFDRSVRTGDIDENLPPETIRTKIRDNWLRDSTVTILLCGTETQYRKHVDWELKSSMIDGAVNKKSGILVIDLPTTSSTSWYASYPSEKDIVYSDYEGGWVSYEKKSQYDVAYPEMPKRIIDNLWNKNANLSVVQWDKIQNDPEKLRWLIDKTAEGRLGNNYDLSLPMRMRDYYPD